MKRGIIKDISNDKDKNKNKEKQRNKIWKNSPVDFDIDLSENAILYAGHVTSGKTHRNKIGKDNELEQLLEQLP